MITDNRCPKCGGADGHTPGCPNRQGNVRVSHTVHTTHHHACDCREEKVKRLVMKMPAKTSLHSGKTSWWFEKKLSNSELSLPGRTALEALKKGVGNG